MFILLHLFFSILQYSSMTDPATIHSFKVESIDGKIIDFSDFKGKKILIVNVASECGYTKQYAQLQELYELHQDKLVIIGFPSNDFGGQEPGTAEEIQQFCSSKFGVTFPLTAKVNIKSSPVHPIYEWLTQKSKNGVLDAEVNWNFNKFLIDENGKLEKALGSSVTPMDEDILNWIGA
jgi:glutathione peroxidase